MKCRLFSVLNLQQTFAEGSVLLLNKCRTTVMCMENRESVSMCECSWLYEKDVVVNDILHVNKAKKQPTP